MFKFVFGVIKDYNKLLVKQVNKVSNSKVFRIDRDFITLSQLLKEEGIIPTGGAAKWFLKEHQVKINGDLDDRRGKKLYPNDQVEIVGIESVKIESKL